MAEREPMEIAMVVVQQDDRYPMQLRGNGSNVGAPGKIGFFGGKVDTVNGRKESPAEAGCRELGEETTLRLTSDALSYVDTVVFDMDHYERPLTVTGHVLRTVIGAEVEVVATEGELVYMTLPEMGKRLDELTPGTYAAVTKLLL